MRKVILLCAFIGAALLPIPSVAQVSAFPRPAWFRQHFTSPQTRAELEPLRRLSDFVAGGNLELSLHAYLELVLENNPDLAVARLSVEQPRNAITRAMAAFDPAFSASFSSQHSTTTSASSLDGTPTVTQLNQPFAGSYTQLLSTGTNLSVQFSATRYSNNLVYSTYNPELSSSFGAQIDHPLLRNRGAVLTKLSVMSARSSLRIGEEQMRWQVMGLIANAENIYWAVVGARESLALANSFLELQAASLDRFKKQVDAAALLPLELYQPESEYAQVQAMVIQAKSALAKQENALRQQIGADLDPAVRDLPIVLTEPLEAAVIGRPIARKPSPWRSKRDPTIWPRFRPLTWTTLEFARPPRC